MKREEIAVAGTNWHRHGLGKAPRQAPRESAKSFNDGQEDVEKSLKHEAVIVIDRLGQVEG